MDDQAIDADGRDAARVALFLDSGDLAIVFLDPGGTVVGWNGGAQRLLGHRAEEIVGRHVSTVHAASDRQTVDARLHHAAGNGGEEEEGWYVRGDRSSIWASVITTPLRSDHGDLQGFACIVRDAEPRRLARLAVEKTAQHLEELAATDSLTGVKNRREFDRMLRTVPREPFALLAVDVDHLKSVNDEHGHEAGDLLLRSVATTLALLVRGWDVLARLGGDEFGALLLGVGHQETAKVAERMRVAMHSLPAPNARISVGWATAPPGADPQAVWKMADHCLYLAKRSGRDRVVGGSVDLDDPVPASEPSSTEMLADVLGGAPLSAVYQPIVALTDGRAIGYEALARPHHLGAADTVGPLFRMARRTGHTRHLDWLCRKAALVDAHLLPPGAALFVNTSAEALVDPMHDVDQLLLLLRWTRWPARQLVLELSGENLPADTGRLQEVLLAYRAEGLRFAVGNVGEAGWTRDLLDAARADFVKVPRSVTITAAHDESRTAIAVAFDVARSSGADVIAEGVENQYAADQMLALGIQLGQGYGLGAPTPPDAVADTAAEWAARAALRGLRPRGSG